MRNVLGADLVQYMVHAPKRDTVRCYLKVYTAIKSSRKRRGGNGIWVGKIAAVICTGNSCVNTAVLYRGQDTLNSPERFEDKNIRSILLDIIYFGAARTPQGGTSPGKRY